jgi:predicted DNA-binding transcriptional regulator AlpA
LQDGCHSDLLSQSILLGWVVGRIAGGTDSSSVVRRSGGGAGDRLLTAREVGERLGLSTESVLRRYRRGELPGFRLASNCLRFDADELAAWLEERRSGPESSTLEPARGEA